VFHSYSIPDDTDVLVNATSIGLYPNISDKPDIDYGSICDGLLVCDVISNPPRTPFLVEAENQDAKTFYGLGMLVNQGTIAFKYWTGRPRSSCIHHAYSPRSNFRVRVAKETCFQLDAGSRFKL